LGTGFVHGYVHRHIAGGRMNKGAISMNRTKWFVAALVMAGSSGAWAQSQPTGQDPNRHNTYGDSNMSVRMRIQKATDLIGKKVQNPQGENLGEIQDLALDPESGRVVYAVLSFGGFLGMGEKWFAIPSSALTLPGSAEHFVLSVDKDRLKAAEGFDKDKWPNMGDSTWGRNVYDYYGQRPYWQDSTQPSGTVNDPNRSKTSIHSYPARIEKASYLIGKDVNSTQGQDIGEINDLAVDVDRHRVAYAVLEYDPSFNAKEKLFAVPWASLNLPSQTDQDLVIAIDKARLDTSEGFNKNAWPDMSNMQWANATYTRFNQTPYWQDGCPGCGIAKASFSSNGTGFTKSGSVYCCKGCAEGTGCTCMAMAHPAR
jgi:sporulation protein YlmC with PRC-barrel domain